MIGYFDTIFSPVTDCHEAMHRCVQMAHLAGCGSACQRGHFFKQTDLDQAANTRSLSRFIVFFILFHQTLLVS